MASRKQQAAPALSHWRRFLSWCATVLLRLFTGAQGAEGFGVTASVAVQRIGQRLRIQAISLLFPLIDEGVGTTRPRRPIRGSADSYVGL